MIKKIAFVFVLIYLNNYLFSQTINHPNFGLKSHPTLDIESVVLTGNSTTLFMVIENRSLEGTFCADKNIFLILPDDNRLKIKEARGIPRCPEAYTFQNFGEKMYFSLSFPAIPEGTQWFDLLEECHDACFSFNDVILDVSLNQRIDQAYALAASKKTEEACKVFEELLVDFAGMKSPYEGAVYWNLIELTKQMGDEMKSIEWLEKLKKSDNPLKDRFIENLNNN